MNSTNQLRNKERVSLLKDRFIVDDYFCRAEDLQTSMNKRFEDGYYPKEIQLEAYQDKTIGFIIYELQDGRVESR